MKWVRVMADYCSDGLWDHEGTMMGRDSLPISTQLKTRHEQWCLWYEKNTKNVPFDYSEFSKEGREISHAIKTELPDWTVIYFDEGALDQCIDDDIGINAREKYEYEITL